MKLQKTLIGIAAAMFAAGCADLTPWTPSWLTVGPDYAEPQIADPGSPAPDAGYPTTNKTATGEFAPADPSADPRTEITTNSVRRWWAQFNDEVLTGLIEAAVSNNLTFLVAQQRLVEARCQHLVPPLLERMHRLLALQDADAAEQLLGAQRLVGLRHLHDDVEVVVHRGIRLDLHSAELRRASQRGDQLRLDLSPLEQEPPVVRARHEADHPHCPFVVKFASGPFPTNSQLNLSRASPLAHLWAGRKRWG